MSNKMNIIWAKEKLREVTSSTDTVTLDSRASGDGSQRCCRLCGGDRGLRSFQEPCLWQGVQEQYDQLLQYCFGVVVTPTDSLICGNCVQQLKITERFKTLVQAAFDKPPSDCSSRTCIARSAFASTKPSETNTQWCKEVKQKPNRPKRRQIRILNPKTDNRRINVACSVCRQRYPMTINVGWKDEEFVCSRCKKNGGSVCRKCNLHLPSDIVIDHMNLHVKADLRRRNRLLATPNRSQLKRCESVIKYHKEPKKYQCRRCSKKFVLPQHLAEHINGYHKDLNNACIVCGKLFKTRELLEKHLKIHTEVFECDFCKKICKSKRALQTHLLTHKKVKTSNYFSVARK